MDPCGLISNKDDDEMMMMNSPALYFQQ